MWYVQFLLINREEIKSTGDFDSDQYSDLLTVEKSMDYLKSCGILTLEDLSIIDEVVKWQSFVIAEATLTRSREYIASRFKAACSKIAFSLGDCFTEDGYLQYMSDKYNLTEEQTEKMREKMQSKLIFKTPRGIQ